MKLRLEVEFEYDEIVMHSGEGDPDAKEWFYKEILADKLDVISGETGDYIGSMKIVAHLTPLAAGGAITPEQERAMEENYKAIRGW